MHTSDFDYHLPEHLIAQTPVEPRDHSRLLVVDTATEELSHRRFYEIGDFLHAGDLLALNNSRVIPARLKGRRPGTGGAVEVLLLHRQEPGVWRAMIRPARRLGQGTSFEIEGVSVEVLEDTGDGTRLIRLQDEGVIHRSGETPLPPYIHAPLADSERYQTVYATREGSAAAPTAGLHFTPELLDNLRSRDIRPVEVTLHVGLDTFRPVRSEEPDKHPLHSEFFQLGEEAAGEINLARLEGRRIICVGTTSARLLEQVALLAEERGSESIDPMAGWADLFILPGHRFRLVDALITNFHLPRSTLLMLVSAFAGRGRPDDAGRRLILRAYREAIEHDYRFYSFGDCMLIL